MSRREVLHNCANRFRLVRLAAGFNKASFAEILGVSHTHVGLIEKDHRQPSRILVQEIADYFFVNLDWLEHGRGWMYKIDNGYFTEELIKCQLRSGQVRRLVIVTYRVEGQRSHKAFLIQIPEGVIPSRVGEISATIPRTPATHHYLNILKCLQGEAIPVGRLHVPAEQADVLNDLDLSPLIAAATVESHIIEKELEAIPEDPEDRAFLEQLAQPLVKRDHRKGEAEASGKTLDPYHMLLMAQPELKPAVQRLLFGPDGATRKLLRRVAEEAEETNQLGLMLLEEMNDEAKRALIRLLREDAETRVQFFRVLDALLQGRSAIELAKELVAAGAHPDLAAAYTHADANGLMAELARQGHKGPWPSIPTRVDEKEAFAISIEIFTGREKSLKDQVRRMCDFSQSGDDLNRLLVYVTTSRALARDRVKTQPG